MASHTQRNRIGTWGGFVLIMIWCLLPVVWIVSLSFKSAAETTAGSPQFFPKAWTTQNYKDILDNPDFTRALLNSAGIALTATFLSVVLATLAAYAIARLDFRGKRAVLFRALDAFRIFDNIFVMTRGAQNTESSSFLTYRQVIEQMQLGMGSALSVLLFLTVLGLAYLIVRLFKVDLAQARGEA